MKTVGVTDYTNQTTPMHFEWNKINGAHLQCVNNHYAKFEYKGIKTI